MFLYINRLSNEYKNLEDEYSISEQDDDFYLGECICEFYTTYDLNKSLMFMSFDIDEINKILDICKFEYNII